MLLQGWIIITVALAYLAVLFIVASYGDRMRPVWMTGSVRPYIYALSLGVYCTSWTFFGSVGFAATRGYDFLTIYIGPILMFALAYPVVLRVVRLAKAQNITSIADFISARYGKNPSLAAIVSLAAVIGLIPYIALQLKAVSISLATVLPQAHQASDVTLYADIGLYVALFLALFTILFGTRHVDATEHQDGLMLAIALESVVKLIAFLIVGAYITWGMFGGLGDIISQASDAGILTPFQVAPKADVWIAMTFSAFVCALLLPRQFHMSVVENRGETEIQRAIWLYPLYLIAINLFVVPIALAGLLHFPDGSVNPDMFVLGLPLSEGRTFITMLAFLGGLSAATAMVIVECVALAVMISNDLIMPLMLRGRDSAKHDMGGRLLIVRRIAIVAILLLAYLYNRTIGELGLVQIGLMSFAAASQFAPAFFGGIFWKRATARGAIAGIFCGFVVWAYTLLLPNLARGIMVLGEVVKEGPFGIAWLRPEQLFGLDIDPFAHAMFWSLLFNALAYGVFSLTRAPEALERLQANAFSQADAHTLSPSFRLWRSSVTVGDMLAAISRYLGEERARLAFEGFERTHGIKLDHHADADIHLLRFAEHLLASAIGASSSRLVISLLLRQRSVSTKAALQLLDDASAAIQYSRDLLQIALDHAKQGITVIDRNLQLACWNQEFRELFDLPPDFLHVGIGLDEIIRFNAKRGLYGPGQPEHFVRERLDRIVQRLDTFRTRVHPSGRVIEIRSNTMPDGGTVTTYTDITETVGAEEALERANETLERRVRERTRELTRLNQELARAKAEADEANISKTRFLAAASHDILQPLNAARLYVSSLVERNIGLEGPDAQLADNIDASLEAVEEILSALLDISRLDTGAMKPELTNFRLRDSFRQLEVEFTPMAQEKGISLRFIGGYAVVRSDRRLLRRLLQNLVSNAIKYTPEGRVLIGCRRMGDDVVRIQVWDTGLGIPASKQRVIFKEFQRLEAGAKVARGLGLGLSIVERIARVLDAPLHLVSHPDKGSVFSIDVPVVAEPPMPLTPDQPVSTPHTALTNMVVLCIDNERSILSGMSTLLSGWNCKVITAESALDALYLLKEEGAAPDVILADYHLDDGSNGLDAISAVRRHVNSALPAVLLTADRSPAVREAARESEVSVLNKPVKPAALRALLAQWQVTQQTTE